MADFYSRLASTVDRLLRDKGKTIYVAHGTTTHTLVGAEFSLFGGRSSINSDQSFAQVTSIRTNSRRLMVAAKGVSFTPKVGDTVKIGADAVSWQLKGVTPVKPGNTILYWDFTVVK